MRSSKQAAKKGAAVLEAEMDRQRVEYDSYRAHLAMSLISDMFEQHGDCRFKDCRSAGRCLAFDRAIGVCLMPLDTTRAMMFVGMIWFHEAMAAAEEKGREAREEVAWEEIGKAFNRAANP